MDSHPENWLPLSMDSEEQESLTEATQPGFLFLEGEMVSSRTLVCSGISWRQFLQAQAEGLLDVCTRGHECKDSHSNH